MIPRTEKELELYFKLLELTEAKKVMDMPYSIRYPHCEYDKERYERIKTEYLQLVQKTIGSGTVL